MSMYDAFQYFAKVAALVAEGPEVGTGTGSPRAQKFNLLDRVHAFLRPLNLGG